MKTDIMNLSIKELEQYLEQLGEKRYRARQIFSWIYKGVEKFDDMANLPKELRNKLDENAELKKLKVLNIQKSKKDGTRKYLFELRDGNSIESVFMKYKFGNTVCISSQAGCLMGCRFCASTINGLQRNLTAGEMSDQVISIERDTEEKISNIVVMGTGEPFNNYENLSKFLRNIHEKEGLNVGMRNITVSTCGLIKKMLEFAKDFPQVNLAVSLHAPNDTIRNKIMPINKRYPLEELLAASRTYVAKTGRRITFEYALVKGINDGEQNAKELAERLRGINCHVNLIPLNQVKETGLHGTERKESELFREVLERHGIQVTIRRELGSGQLRLKSITS
ncbi:MAG TPA: 23S rRNA (adenine(2503)-C(2))-methyltransferase RlmN [Clostridiales bacterium]|nr:23S rRNA (adenine(2503)-C(2))-methyltransferase RlmN [Clostridiales bacterium]